MHLQVRKRCLQKYLDIIGNNQNTAFKITQSYFNTIRNCNILNFSIGIYHTYKLDRYGKLYGRDLTILNNKFNYNKQAIFLQYVTTVNIKNTPK